MYIRQRHEHDYALTAPLCADPFTMTALAVAGTAVSVGSTLVGASMAQQGAKAQAKSEQAAAEYRAKQLEMKAQESRATSQRAALDTVKKGELAQSSLRARAAASGAGAGDESVLALGEQIAGQGEYERLMQMYSGENAAVGYTDAATSERYNGQAALAAGANKAKAIQIGAIGSVAQSVGGFAEKAAGFGKLPTAASTYGASTAGPLDASNYSLRDGGFHLGYN